MRDWEKVIRDRMRCIRLAPQTKDELITELASHLQELYEQCRAEGVSEEEAFALCVVQAEEAQSSVRRMER
jgi:hypothetical protein